MKKLWFLFEYLKYIHIFNINSFFSRKHINNSSEYKFIDSKLMPSLVDIDVNVLNGNERSVAFIDNEFQVSGINVMRHFNVHTL